MFKFLFGKEVKEIVEKKVESMAGEFYEGIAEKIARKTAEKLAIKTEPTVSEEVRIAAEKRKLEIEEAKLQIEREKLDLENGKKLDVTLEVAKIGAKSTRHAAYVRGSAAFFTATGLGVLTYNYFRPHQDRLDDTKVELASTKSELTSRTEEFVTAQAYLEQCETMLKQAESVFVDKCEDKSSVNEYEKFKQDTRAETDHKIHRMKNRMAYKELEIPKPYSSQALK